MNAVTDGEVQLDDRFTYGASPFGDRVLMGGLAGSGSILLAIAFLSRSNVSTFLVVLAGFLTLSWLCYVRLLKVHSDIVLDESGVTRYVASKLWLHIPWSAIEKVTIRRVYESSGNVGMKGYYLSLKKGDNSHPALPREHKIQGKMSRRVQFYETFLANLHLRGIAVDEQDSRAP